MAAANVFPRPVGSQSLKRKLNDPTTSFSRTSSKKAAKHSESDSPRGHPNGHTTAPKAATVEDDEDHDDGQEAGPALPPDTEEVEDEDPEDDEEGRFFGGGVSKKEKDVLDYIEQNEDDEPPEEINLAWLKKTALSFERKINKNAELRAKYEDDPMKFVSSEADLDSEIKSLSLLTDHTNLYKDFVRSGCSDSLVGLLSHDNTDIAIAACEVIADLIDEDSGASSEEWSTLVNSMLKADLIDLLVSNLSRLDESIEGDNAGVYHVLNVVENLLSDTGNTSKLGNQSALLTWLLNRINKADNTALNKVGQNRQYTAEILTILAQNDSKAGVALINQGAIDTLLQQLSTWRRRDPEKDSEEEEFAGNLFDCLVALVNSSDGRNRFVSDEGVELCLLMLKEGKFSKTGAFRVLDHAAAGFESTDVCAHIVEAGGLKPLFTSLMKSKKLDRQNVEHLIGILASLLRSLPGGSAARVRTLAKFVEKDYEKCQRLLELRKEYASRLATVDRGIEHENKDLTTQEIEESEDENLSRRMDAGLFPLQSLDVILAWLVAEDGGARGYITGSTGLTTISHSLKEQIDGIQLQDTTDALATRDMLQALVSCLE